MGPGDGYSGPDAERAAVAAFERAIGRKLAINNLYVPWTGPMPTATARWDLARGTLPMISWAGTRTSQIAAGADDSTIREEALQLKALRAPVLLRWFAEMDIAENRCARLLAGDFRSGLAADPPHLPARGRDQRALGVVPQHHGLCPAILRKPIIRATHT